MVYGESGLPFTPTSESVHVDTNPPSEIEVIREIVLLENNAAGLSPSSFNDGDEVLISELGKLESIWIKEQTPMKLCESVIYRKGDY